MITECTATVIGLFAEENWRTVNRYHAGNFKGRRNCQ
jgi:hypothetical protein